MATYGEHSEPVPDEDDVTFDDIDDILSRTEQTEAVSYEYDDGSQSRVEGQEPDTDHADAGACIGSSSHRTWRQCCCAVSNTITRTLRVTVMPTHCMSRCAAV